MAKPKTPSKPIAVALKPMMLLPLHVSIADIQAADKAEKTARARSLADTLIKRYTDEHSLIELQPGDIVYLDAAVTSWPASTQWKIKDIFDGKYLRVVRREPNKHKLYQEMVTKQVMLEAVTGWLLAPGRRLSINKKDRSKYEWEEKTPVSRDTREIEL